MESSDFETAAPPTAADTGNRPEPSAPVTDTTTAVDAGGNAGDTTGDEAGAGEAGGDGNIGEPTVSTGPKKRRRGSRGGKNRKRPPRPMVDGEPGDDSDVDDLDDLDDDDDDAVADADGQVTAASDDADHIVGRAADHHPELPERIGENRPSVEAAEQALVRKPQIGDTRPMIGDTRPAPAAAAAAAGADKPASGQGRGDGQGQGQRNRGGKGQQGGGRNGQQAERQNGQGERAAGQPKVDASAESESHGESDAAKKKRRRGGKGRSGTGAGTGGGRPDTTLSEMDPAVLELRRGRERNGRPIGRYLMCVQVRPTLTQVAVLEGRNLIEHYVSRPADDVSQIHGNIYVGKVQNVLPGMEAAFVDIGTPKNAVLYRGDVQYDAEDIVEKNKEPRIEQMLRAKQLIVCQVTKNPIGAKGARLTQEVSLPGRFVVLIPHSKTYGISKRLPDDVRKRLRNILDRVKPAEHGLIVRTAAEHATEHELRADMTRLLDQWNAIEAKAKKSQGPTLLYREPELAVRVIREEFNAEYRGVVIDDQRLHDDVKDYVTAFNPELADRVEFYDEAEEGLPMYERFHIHEQLHKALDRKVWLPSGGSLIIEHTEALTVIDVNTGKNVGTSNLEETVFRNNLEAAEEVAKQLRLRDIGGIVVIDFIDMEIKDNRRKVVDSFRSALARDKTRTQVFDISELGLVEMTRKRIGEGLLVNFADQCPNCEGRGLVIDHAMLE